MGQVIRYDVVVARGLCWECAEKIVRDLKTYASIERVGVPDYFDTRCTACGKGLEVAIAATTE